MPVKEKISQEELNLYLTQGKSLFENLNLSGLDFGNYKISEKEFRNCDLTNANFVTNHAISDCKFIECDISHTRFKDIMTCDFEKNYGFQTDFQNSEITETNFKSCDFERAIFSNSNMLETSFDRCTIKDSNFRESELFTVKFFNNTQIFESYFNESNINNSEFSDVMIYGSEINNSNIKNSYFGDTKIVESSLDSSNIESSDFRTVDMVSNDLSNAKFTECDLFTVYFSKPIKGLSSCKFDQCALDPYVYTEEKIDNLRKELIKEQSFYEAYTLIELNDKIPISDLAIQFMKDVVKEHGTDAKILQKAVEIVGIKDSLRPQDMAKLLNDTLKTEEYKKAYGKEQSQHIEKVL